MSPAGAALRRTAATPAAAAALALASAGASSRRPTDSPLVTSSSSASSSSSPKLRRSAASAKAMCQPPSVSEAASAAREARRSGSGSGSDRQKNAPPSLDLRAIMAGPDGDRGASKSEIVARARAEIDSKFGEMYERHPCGMNMREWHMCVLDQMESDEPTVKEAANLTEKEVSALRQTQIHRRCADPHLLSLLVCLKDEHRKEQLKVINDVGREKFDAMCDDRDQKIMEERGYDFMKSREEAEARTDAVAEAFREREGMAPPEELPGPVVEEKKWWEIWKEDDKDERVEQEPVLTEEQIRRKEELRAQADAMLGSMKEAREERNIDSTFAKERGFGQSEGSEGSRGGKGWWRFGF